MAMPFDLEKYQQVLFPYAYNILGSAEDARDVIQETMIRWQNVDHKKVENQKAYLIRAVINSAINYKEGQKEKLHDYTGDWLPEPMVVEAELDRKHILSYSLLVLLEQLNAKERAIFILKESFDFSHAEIAELLEITIESSRQILKRSKEKLKPNMAVSKGKHQEKLQRFVELIMSGNTQALEEMLAHDVRVTSDGGKAPAARKVLIGAETVRKLIMGIFEKFLHDLNVTTAIVNHQPAIIYRRGEKPYACHILSFDDRGRVGEMHMVVNPEKLKGLELNFP
ncbi:RNA polymerase, sigma-24 subunit, ECF subfamily [Fulvivirga imtechensis AK7]|uniref:RNA polymerase, sigma-24 subunit, ECF subfamily n=1 Tax=Fulvivirga imtechensis AK7 TaxID=1237149 RepID=L8JNI1_9BACT|nr:sigma-70 family RNA polymerase sigma factor [Fulvivirga imtechensis]ELR68932.1 RNA polymerase, sigma-24 subunit, ECF subfamily [Fulvivirga imtechensis AK7]